MSFYERERHYSRHKEDSPSDDEYKETTVRRYKVGGGSSRSQVERVDRRDEPDDDYRSKYSYRDDYRDSRNYPGRTSGEVVEVDRRVERYTPDRPRSTFEPPAQRTVVEKRVIERESSDVRDRDRDDRYRFVERDREVDYQREPERRERVVRETRDVVVERESPHDDYWDHRSRWDERDDHVDDVRIDKRIVRRSDDHVSEVRVEKSIERDSPHYNRDGEVERYRKEVEYYSPADPPPQPIVIRQRQPEPQQIIVQEAPAPPPVFIDRPQKDPGYIVLREKEREVARREPKPQDEEYYYRREERDKDGRRIDGGFFEERHERRHRDYPSDEEDVYVKRTIVRRERSESSGHRRRHIAEGALAGAGLSALVGSRRGPDGELPSHRGRKVLAGAALGALGTEVIRRARSAYEDKYDDRDDDGRYDNKRHRSRSKSRSRLATGLAIVRIPRPSVPSRW
jgi:hypothetical protein